MYRSKTKRIRSISYAKEMWKLHTEQEATELTNQNSESKTHYCIQLRSGKSCDFTSSCFELLIVTLPISKQC